MWCGQENPGAFPSDYGDAPGLRGNVDKGFPVIEEGGRVFRLGKGGEPRYRMVLCAQRTMTLRLVFPSVTR